MFSVRADTSIRLEELPMREARRMIDGWDLTADDFDPDDEDLETEL
jgi:hypothetical protein